jgi:hypothetical protein
MKVMRPKSHCLDPKLLPEANCFFVVRPVIQKWHFWRSLCPYKVMRGLRETIKTSRAPQKKEANWSGHEPKVTAN